MFIFAKDFGFGGEVFFWGGGRSDAIKVSIIPSKDRFSKLESWGACLACS